MQPKNLNGKDSAEKRNDGLVSTFHFIKIKIVVVVLCFPLCTLCHSYSLERCNTYEVFCSNVLLTYANVSAAETSNGLTLFVSCHRQLIRCRNLNVICTYMCGLNGKITQLDYCFFFVCSFFAFFKEPDKNSNYSHIISTANIHQLYTRGTFSMYFNCVKLSSIIKRFRVLLAMNLM